MRVFREEMLGWIERIVAFGVRRPGYPADLLTEEFVESQFRGCGLTGVERQPVPVLRWMPSRTELGSPLGAFECSPIPYTAWTPAAGTAAPGIYLGDGRPQDFAGQDVAGKFVVADMRFADLAAAPLKAKAFSVYDPRQNVPDGVLHKANWLITNFTAYYLAQLNGAAGFVGILGDGLVDGCAFYAPYDGFLKELPGVWVGREHAGALRAAAGSGQFLRLLSLGQAGETDSHNVVGWVRGRGSENILVTCHHDGPFASAVEDASGLAVLLALAKSFTGHPGSLERNLLFVAASGHFHGGIGSRAFAARHGQTWLKDTVAALGVEHIGQEAEPDGNGYRLTGRPEVRACFTSENPALNSLVADGVRRWELERTLVLPPYLFGSEPPCDAAPYFLAGIPSVSLISGAPYMFDGHDTLDKVRAEDLLPVTGFFEDLIRRLDRIPSGALEAGLSRRRGDPPAPPPPWFLPPQAVLHALKART